jgi:hypothetical protein
VVGESGKIGLASVADGPMPTATSSAPFYSQTSGTSDTFRCVTWNGSTFAALAFDGADLDVYTSTDGASWSNVATITGVDADTTCVQALGSTLVLLAFDGTDTVSYTSTDDGANWSGPNTVASGANLNRLASSGSQLVAGGASTTTYDSTDGSTWTSHTPGHSGNVAGFAWSPTLALWCMVTDLGEVYTSSDGASWSAGTTITDDVPLSICWSPTRSLFVSFSFNYAFRSADGATFVTDSDASLDGFSQADAVIGV